MPADVRRTTVRFIPLGPARNGPRRPGRAEGQRGGEPVGQFGGGVRVAAVGGVGQRPLSSAAASGSTSSAIQARACAMTRHCPHVTAPIVQVRRLDTAKLCTIVCTRFGV